MAITNDSSNVFALQKLYIAMGGSPTDIQNMQTENAMIEKIRALLSSGGGSGGPAYETIDATLMPDRLSEMSDYVRSLLNDGEHTEVKLADYMNCQSLLEEALRIKESGKIPCIAFPSLPLLNIIELNSTSLVFENMDVQYHITNADDDYYEVKTFQVILTNSTGAIHAKLDQFQIWVDNS